MLLIKRVLNSLNEFHSNEFAWWIFMITFFKTGICNSIQWIFWLRFNVRIKRAQLYESSGNPHKKIINIFFGGFWFECKHRKKWLICDSSPRVSTKIQTIRWIYILEEILFLETCFLYMEKWKCIFSKIWISHFLWYSKKKRIVTRSRFSIVFVCVWLHFIFHNILNWQSVILLDFFFQSELNKSALFMTFFNGLNGFELMFFSMSSILISMWTGMVSDPIITYDGQCNFQYWFVLSNIAPPTDEVQWMFFGKIWKNN